MRSEQQHIDDFFRKKEEEFQQDTGHADAHWEQMRGLLKPAIGPDPVPKGYRLSTSRRIIKYLGGFTVVTVITLVTLTTIRSKKKAAPKGPGTENNGSAGEKAAGYTNNYQTRKIPSLRPASKAVPATAPKATTGKHCNNQISPGVGMSVLQDQ